MAVRNRFIAQFMPPAKIQETVLETTINDTAHRFVTKGKILKELGYKKVEDEQTKDVILPSVDKGLIVNAKEVKVTEHKTKPPAPYTERTLLRAMETCGKQFKEEQKDDTEFMEAILNGFSIGTPATRGDTLKKLNTTQYTVMQKKNIRCTPKGRYIIENLPVKELMDLEYTGKLEKTLQDIEKGSVLKQEFLEHIKNFVSEAVKAIKTQKSTMLTAKKSVNVTHSTNKKADTKTKTETAPKQRETLGKCPICGEAVVEGTKGFGCMGYKIGCKFVIWKDNAVLAKYKRKVTKTVVKAILKKGETILRNVEKKEGVTVDLLVKYTRESTDSDYRFVISEQ